MEITVTAKLLVVLIGLVVIGSAVMVRIIVSVYAMRRHDQEDLSRWENEGGAAPNQGDYLPY